MVPTGPLPKAKSPGPPPPPTNANARPTAAPATLLRPKAKAVQTPASALSSSALPKTSSLGARTPVPEGETSEDEHLVPVETIEAREAAAGRRAKCRTPTPAGPRRVRFVTMTEGGVNSDSAVTTDGGSDHHDVGATPIKALSAMRE